MNLPPNGSPDVRTYVAPPAMMISCVPGAPGGLGSCVASFTSLRLWAKSASPLNVWRTDVPSALPVTVPSTCAVRAAMVAAATAATLKPRPPRAAPVLPPPHAPATSATSTAAIPTRPIPTGPIPTGPTRIFALPNRTAAIRPTSYALRARQHPGWFGYPALSSRARSRAQARGSARAQPCSGMSKYSTEQTPEYPRLCRRATRAAKSASHGQGGGGECGRTPAESRVFGPLSGRVLRHPRAGLGLQPPRLGPRPRPGAQTGVTRNHRGCLTAQSVRCGANGGGRFGRAKSWRGASEGIGPVGIGPVGGWGSRQYWSHSLGVCGGGGTGAARGSRRVAAVAAATIAARTAHVKGAGDRQRRRHVGTPDVQWRRRFRPQPE